MSKIGVNPAEDGRDEEITIICPSCKKKTHAKRVYSAVSVMGFGQYDYFCCQQCGAIFINPLPSNDELNEIYEKYWQFGSLPQGFRTLETKYLSLLRKSRIRFARPHSKPGNVLDIGCNTGEFLRAMKDFGWEVWGNDISYEAAEEAKKNVGSDRICLGNLKDCKFPDSYFHTITLWHVLEHVKDPSDLLKEARRILRPDGNLIIEVPNGQSLSLKLFGDDYSLFSHTVPQHIFYWSTQALNTLLEENGFCVVAHNRIGATPLPLEFSRSLGNRLSKRLGSLVGRICFLLSIPISLFNSFFGNFLFCSGEVLRVKARKVHPNA